VFLKKIASHILRLMAGNNAARNLVVAVRHLRSGWTTRGTDDRGIVVRNNETDLTE
jgi:hypothetical protein